MLKNFNLSKLKDVLIDQYFDAILISSPTNLYYSSGFVCLSPLEREAYVLITKQQSYLITSPLYAGDINLLQEIQLIKTTNKSYEEIISSLIKKHDAKKVGFEANFISVGEYEHLQNQIKEDFNQDNPITFAPVNLRNLRIEKTEEEISLIEQACKIGDDTFSFILNEIKPGISEKEIASEMEIFIRRNGAVLSFPSIIAFGKNAAIPHHVTSDYKIAQNNFLLLDFGVKVNEYCSDMTRTIYIGKPTDVERKIYETVLEAQKRAIDYVQKTQNTQQARESDSQTVRKSESLNLRQSDTQSIPKIQASIVDKISRDYITSQGFPDFPHTLGHGIGLAVHEAPSLYIHSKDELKCGMVFSIEPGIYLHGKTGVRIEDLMVIEEKKARVLTKASKELITV